MAEYTSTSPYFTTAFTTFYLDPMVNRAIPRENDDVYFSINQTYQYRPDMLAYDLYQQSGLWWVFYQRNPNTLTAPPWDFDIGKSIYLPKLATLRTALGF
jgi:hypothetical protein